MGPSCLSGCSITGFLPAPIGRKYIMCDSEISFLDWPMLAACDEFLQIKKCLVPEVGKKIYGCIPLICRLI
jgi:hypothetical protein